MCQPNPLPNYSPRTLVAVMAADGDSGASGLGSGGAAPNPPAGPSPDAAWRNLKQPMPLGRKIRLTVRNTSIKIKTHQSCCGHPGEPGC
ncbi:MAG: hypothetical protein P4L93_11890 [Coriobacteriia bacterium]|nr:hypothetical protein [Coriobacteriia bacterium]